MNKIYGLMAFLGWASRRGPVNFSEKLFDEILENCAAKGVNTVMWNVADGIQYKSHPEVATEGALPAQYVRDMVKKMKSMGITPMPKLNFSTSHDAWMGDWTYRVSSKAYYGFCRDMIAETAELFDGPEIFHIGLDEEDAIHQKGRQYIVFRDGDLKWSDYNFYMDCVKENGARPAAWSDVFWYDPEGCVKNISKDLILFPWYYGSIHPENYRPIAEREEWIEWYAKPEYAGMDIRFVEDDPDWVRQRKTLLTAPQAGYDVIPCVSTFYGCQHNTEDVMEYVEANVPQKQILGYMTAPWKHTTEEFREDFDLSIDLMQNAKKKLGL